MPARLAFASISLCLLTGAAAPDRPPVCDGASEAGFCGSSLATPLTARPGERVYRVSYASTSYLDLGLSSVVIRVSPDGSALLQQHHAKDIVVPAEDLAAFEAVLPGDRFDTLPVHVSSNCLDGGEIVIERVRDGRYHGVVRADCTADPDRLDEASRFVWSTMRKLRTPD